MEVTLSESRCQKQSPYNKQWLKNTMSTVWIHHCRTAMSKKCLHLLCV